MSEAERLGRLLLRPRNLESLAQGDAEALARLAAVRQALVPPRGHRSAPRIAQGVMSFRLAPRNTPYPELKYACYGVARPMDWEGRILLAEASLLDQLLAAVKALRGRPRYFQACYRGLLTAWVDDIEGDREGFGADHLRPGAATLGRFLADMGSELAHAPRTPRWAAWVLDVGLGDPARLRQLLAA